MTETPVAGSADLRKFGLLFAALGAVIAGLFWWKGNAGWWIPAVCAVSFAAAGTVAPWILRPLYVPWMAFAKFLGWLNTRILLTLFFVLVITPVGLVIRLLRKDLLDERSRKSALTYWKPRDVTVIDKSRYENLF